MEEVKNMDTKGITLKQSIYAGRVIIFAAMVFAVGLGIIAALRTPKVTYTEYCKVQSPLKSVCMTNGEIICIDGRELVKVSTVDAFESGYMSIIHELDIGDNVVSEDIEICGRKGTLFTVPSREGIGNAIIDMEPTTDTAKKYYVLLNDSEGEHEYMLGTYLNKEQLISVMEYVELP